MALGCASQSRYMVSVGLPSSLRLRLDCTVHLICGPTLSPLTGNASSLPDEVYRHSASWDFPFFRKTESLVRWREALGAPA